MFLSKSDYIIGLDCIKQLWLKKNRKDLEPEYDERTLQNFAIGDMVQDLARDYYPGGIMVDAETWDVIGGAEKTKILSESNDILYEATAKLDNGCFCRIDVLIRNGDAWDLIEIKSATSVKSYYIDDLAFQKYVFENAGYPVKNCKVLHLNSGYFKHGELDIKQLFTEDDVSEDVNAKENEVKIYVEGMLSYQTMPDEPEISMNSKCSSCPYYGYCCKDVPEYSVFDLLSAKKAALFYKQTKSLNVEDLPEDWCTTDKQLIDRAAYINKAIHVEKENIEAWLNTLEYPLYYLDYETVQLAIPMFDDSNPYGQIPFQFSLHIQDAPGAEPRHVEFLHQERSDPRRAIAEFLVKNCGKSGSVIAYNKQFEMGCNTKLAELFPDLSADIEAINERMVDLLIPFRNRALYSYKQNGSASIKYVLPAFSDLSYKGMNIANGEVAMRKYAEFLEGKQTAEESKQMFADLLKYCGQDTYAMVLLIDVLYKYAQGEN
jgi:predicted RecB family nuclease